jgi:hypothetical protein
LGRYAKIPSFLLFLLSFASLVGDVDPAFGVPRLFFGEASGVDLVLLMPWLVAATAVGLVGSVILVWRETAVSLLRKVHMTMLAVLALALVWWLSYWNILGL